MKNQFIATLQSPDTDFPNWNLMGPSFNQNAKGNGAWVALAQQRQLEMNVMGLHGRRFGDIGASFYTAKGLGPGQYIPNYLANRVKGDKEATNSVPAQVINANKGLYLGNHAELILKPEIGLDGTSSTELGTSQSMMAQTNPTQQIEVDFRRHRRGVHNIINIIRNGGNSLLNQNYQSQKSREFVIGYNEYGAPKRAKQRYTIVNPYKGATSSKNLMHKN